jgi:hypothetical protein
MGKFVPAVVIVALLLTGCASASVSDFAADGSCDGARATVNFAGLGEDISSCVSISGDSATAKDVFAASGVSTEGTKAYGDMVLCRVNGVPGKNQQIVIADSEPYIEACEELPAAFAYWGFYLRAQGTSDWVFAPEAVTDLLVRPGDSIGLAFSLGGTSLKPTE